MYVIAAVFGVVGVLSGSAPKETLIGLPIGVLLAGFYLRAGFSVKMPPG
jgi:hypothetical protein